MGVKISKTALVIFILLAVFFLVYSPHLIYKYPLHADEWVRLTLAKAVNYEDISLGPLKYEIGFIYFLNFLDKFVDLLNFYRFLPAVFAVLTCFCLFLFVQYISKDYYLSVLSMVLYASLKSNVNILGSWFFTPLAMASPFIFLYSLFFIKGFKEEFYNFIIAFLILVLVTFIHPLTVFFLLLISFIYFVVYLAAKEIDLALIKKLAVIGVIGMIFGIIMVILFNISLSQLRFRTWTDPSINYSLFFIYGVLPLIFAFLGFYLILKKKDIYLTSWFIIGIVNFYFFKIFKFTFLIPYERGIYYLLLSLPIFTSFGLLYFKSLFKFKKLIFALILILTIINAFYGYYDFHSHKYYDFDGEAKSLAIYFCVENENNITNEAKKCVYPNFQKYTHYLEND